MSASTDAEAVLDTEYDDIDEGEGLRDDENEILHRFFNKMLFKDLFCFEFVLEFAESICE